ncbi:MAG: octaprenyl-diphosphate synthase [Candidatus Azotimanducaceae bacterium]|jgi:octaprenyl-diphosphate synthase|tara:strand:+ start:4009 stop:5040 length:1032 start_codon:yes stop_codon:yes gene_type:complete
MEISTARITKEESSDSNPLAQVYQLVAEEFAAVNHLIPRKLSSDVAMVEEISKYIVESGGKRLRPVMVLLSSQALGYKGQQNVALAAIIEFLHTATLLHDDVVDRSGLRRGKTTANEKWGNAPSVLVGDFLYSRAFQLMVELARIDIMAVLSSATNTIAEGEVMQLANVGNTELSEENYREVIRCKTALLFEAATHTGALLAFATDTSADSEQIEMLRKFGLHFGLAYQLVDDWLDYAGDTETMGKNAGDDLAEGKLTLPLIQALKVTSEADQKLIKNALQNKSVEQMHDVLAVVKKCGALDYTYAAAVKETNLALECIARLPDTPYRTALSTLTTFSLSRLG